MLMSNLNAEPFAETIRARGLLTPEQSSRLERAAAQENASFVRLVYSSGFVDQQVLATELSRHFGIRMLEEAERPKGPVLPQCISHRFMREHRVLPLWADLDTITVAISDPSDHAVINAIRVATEREVDLRLATESQIMSLVEKQLDHGASGIEEMADANGAGSLEDEGNLKDLALDAPVIDLVNRLFREASAARATDLHIEPARGKVVVRRRVDGMLQDAGILPADFGRAAVSRVKILTQLNIAERRLPQDGRARVRAGDREYDIRVATMPTIHGESIAIRFLSATNQTPHIDKLGLTARDLKQLKAQAHHDHGLIIVTGPTGSGKTTTLAAVIDHLNNPAQKLVTIEDPVEYQVEGVNQIQVRAEIGLTFAAILRSLLRLDPDTIMIGEMRDGETATIGVNAALTGHLVLTTLHTNSAAAAVTRLLDLGVQAYLIASTLRCVVAQRLVRRLCGNCRQPYEAGPDILELMPAEAARHRGETIRLWKAKGCDHCGNTGYMGRAAIFEILLVGDDVRRLIRPDISADVISRQAVAEGMTTMFADGFTKAQDGVTTIEELLRAVSED